MQHFDAVTRTIHELETHFGEAEPPIDLDSYLRRWRITLDRWPFAGAIEELITDESIAIAERIGDPDRERELIAHALGHWYLHVAHAQLFIGGSDAIWLGRQEREAWDFARKLLVPQGWLLDDLERPVWEIAEACQVTPRFADEARRLLMAGRS